MELNDYSATNEYQSCEKINHGQKDVTPKTKDQSLKTRTTVFSLREILNPTLGF